jgi:hypothetical protein
MKKNVFVGNVMICSLLLAICSCSNGLPIQQEPALELPEKPGIDQGETVNNDPDFPDDWESNDPDLTDIDQEETGDNDPDSPDEQEPNEPDSTEVEPPEFAGFNLFSKKEIHFIFSAAVKNVSCTFTPRQEIDCIQDGEIIKVFLKENLELQTEFLIELNVKDDWENSLSIEVPLFVNDWIPKMEINELRTEYSGSVFRSEFIEFKVKSAGDLDGLKLFIMWNVKTPYIFDFPAVDVKLGEYIVFHLRTLENNCVDELGEDLSESAGTDSCPTARDLWFSGSAKWLHKTDIVYLQDANGSILDAVILNENPGETWSLGHFAEIAEDLYNRGAWKSADGQLPGPFDAVDTSPIKSSKTKSISRYEGKENTHTANDWHITGNGEVTPGQPNK